MVNGHNTDLYLIAAYLRRKVNRHRNSILELSGKTKFRIMNHRPQTVARVFALPTFRIGILAMRLHGFERCFAYDAEQFAAKTAGA